MPSDAPPSYESVVNGLKEQLANKTPQDLKEVHDILQNLPEAQKQVLVNHAPGITAQNTLSDAQKNTAGQAMILAAHTEFAKENIKLNAQAASDAIKKVEAMFSTCLQDLSTIDKDFPTIVPPGGFVGKLRPIQDNFRTVVSDSRILAVKIATYGERFDQIIIPIVQSKEITVDKKKQKLDEFIKAADDFMKDSGAINARYQGLKGEMDIFVGSFGNFAATQEESLNQKITDINTKITALTKEIGDKKIAMYVLLGVAGAALPVSGVIAAFCGPAAPAVLLVGAIVAGVTAITAVTLACVINGLEDEKKAKETERDALDAQKKKIIEARKKLDGLKTTQFPEFKTNVDVLAAFWTSAQADAQAIKNWLESGKPDADMPPILQVSADNAISIYKVLAAYLTQYAKGVDNASSS